MSRHYRNPRMTPDDEISSRFGEFTGLVNTRSRKAIGLHSLYVADNVFLSDDKKVVRRPGYTSFFTGAVRGGFTVGRDLYLDDAGSLKRRVSATDIRVVTTGLTGTAYQCIELNGSGYFTNGVDAGVVRGDTYQPLRIAAPVLSSVTLIDSGPAAAGFNNIGDTYTTATWRFCATYETADGREGPPSEVVEVSAPPMARLFRAACALGYAKTHHYATAANGTTFRRVATTVAIQCTFAPALAGRVLTTQGTSPLPLGAEKLCFYQGRLYVAEYLSATDESVIWFSTASALFLFKLSDNYHMVSGRVVLMTQLGDGTKMFIGTTQKVYTVSGEQVVEEASYGLVSGQGGDVDAEGIVYFWTERGFCKSLPFKNLTEQDVSMPPGVRAAFKVVYLNGMVQLMTITQGGGTPFNIRSERS